MKYDYTTLREHVPGIITQARLVRWAIASTGLLVIFLTALWSFKP